MKSEKRKWVRVAMAVLPVIILGGASVWAWNIQQNRTEPEVAAISAPVPFVEVETAAYTQMTLRVMSQGFVEPSTSTSLTALVGGRVLEVSDAFKVGGFFRAGEPMLRLDQTTHAAAVAMALAELAEADVNLERMKAAASQAQKDWDRLGRGDASRLALHGPQLKEAVALQEARRAALQVMEQNLAGTVVTAPYNCRIRKIEASLGQHLEPGSLIAEVFSTDSVEIRLPVRDEELALLGTDLLGELSEDIMSMPVELTAEFLGSTSSWPGTIVRSEGIIDTTNRMIYLVAQVTDPYAQAGDGRAALPVGLHVRAEISGKSVAQVVKLPARALVDGSSVLVVDRDNRLWRRSVRILQHRGADVLIDQGLSPGDQICISALDFYADGTRVRTNIGNHVAGVIDE